ncbi:MAG TPA: class II aldolase/adducin family protein [Stellaceae bacterium]|nr:class II aldolase/adducin family protein [Stellaceae bacterium]
MSDLDQMLNDLVVANRILAHQGVVDAYGHVSIRHPDRPDRFFLSRSRSPELVTRDDLLEFDLDCNPIDQRGREIYIERPIHGGIYQARPDVQSVIHNHSLEVIPFSISKTTKLRPVFHTAASIGVSVPTWDIRDKFGDTNLLVTTMAQGHDLAKTLDKGYVCLMRGHGCAVAGSSLYDAVHTAVLLQDNAKLQAAGLRLGEITYLSPGEVEKAGRHDTQSRTSRAWEYWSRRCGADRL